MSRFRSMTNWLRSQKAPNVPPPSAYARDILKAQDPATPQAELAEIAGRPWEYTTPESAAIWIQLAQNPNSPKEVLAEASHREPALVARNPATLLRAVESPNWPQEYLSHACWLLVVETLEQRKAREKQEQIEWETDPCDGCWNGRVPLGEKLCARCKERGIKPRPTYPSPRDEEDDDAIPF